MEAPRHILILEDNEERIAAFEETVRALAGDWTIKVWRDAPTMIRECARFLPSTFLISLDHDLNPQPGVRIDPGTGVDVSRQLSLFPPVCPVILHSSNHERVYSMHNELRFAGWTSERIGPLGDDWIGKAWRRQAEALLARCENRFVAKFQADHGDRVMRAKASLVGLAIGDALGELLASQAQFVARMLTGNELPSGPWFHTDDTEMALSVVEVLQHHGFVEQEALARRFARRFEIDEHRGYGRMTRIQLREVLAGASWKTAANAAFAGQGSLGNGGAMRVAPLGAFLADDLAVTAHEAARSAEVTHTHPEGIAGTIAIAVAAAIAAQKPPASPTDYAAEMYQAVLDLTPTGKVRNGIERARSIPQDADPLAVGLTLGNGSQITAPDTVPFTLWCAARHIDDLPLALAASICSGGDCDTNAAIVGGIVTSAAGCKGVPESWQKEMEPLKFL